MKWIAGALYGGYMAANVLKWYWWRFNSYGYFWGMVAGILGAMSCRVVPELLPNLRRSRRDRQSHFRSDLWSLSLARLRGRQPAHARRKTSKF